VGVQASQTPVCDPNGVRNHLRVRLADGRLFATLGVSTLRQGTGRPCSVCRRGIDPPAIEREVEGPSIFGLVHEGVCHQMWREESGATSRIMPEGAASRGRLIPFGRLPGVSAAAR
jgi:hypothetical protein